MFGAKTKNMWEVIRNIASMLACSLSEMWLLTSVKGVCFWSDMNMSFVNNALNIKSVLFCKIF